MNQEKSIEKYIRHIETLMKNLGNVKAFKLNDEEKLYIYEDDIERINHWYYYNSLLECLLTKEKEKGTIVITDQFEFVSDSLLSSPLNAQEKMAVLFYLIIRNIDLGGILKEDKVRGLIKYNKFLEYGLDQETVNDLFLSGEIECLLYSDDSTLNEEALHLKNMVKKCIVLLDKGNPFVIAHKTIKNHFLDKMAEYEEEDIVQVHQALLELEVDKRICNVVKVVLQNQLRDRRKSEMREDSTQKVSVNSKIEETKKYLSEEEYKTLKKEVSTYFNLHTAMPTRELTLGEVLYCATLLYQLGEEKEMIRALYDRSDYSKKIIAYAEENPITAYLTVYDQLKFYEKKLDLEDSITLLDSYFQETFLSEPEEYSVWKQSIGEELNHHLKKIPAGYQYEIKTKPQYEKNILKIKVRNTKKR